MTALDAQQNLTLQESENGTDLALPPPLQAMVRGQVMEYPKDLYIPPDAMKVLLDTFEGPLDFLLYLIRKQNIDILDIPIATVTQQYMNYIDLMQELSLELAAEYLVMAAILAEIKSRMLLPKPPISEESSEEDPRAELVRRLQEYERYKKAAEALDQLPRLERDIFPVENGSDHIAVQKPLPKVLLTELTYVLVEMLKRVELETSHRIQLESLSVREKMTLILNYLTEKPHCLFHSLFNLKEGRLGIVVTFLATLELLKQKMIDFVQSAPFSPIYLSLKTSKEG